MPSTTRRAVLGALAGGSLAALAGCSSSCPDSGAPEPDASVATGGETVTFGGPPATDWPAPRYDAGNTGFAPDARLLDAPLEVRWRARIAADGPDPAAASAPVVAGDRVVLATAGGVAALRFRDGAEVWQSTAVTPATTTDDRRYGEEPAAPVLGGEGTAYVAGDDALVALDLADGSERWRYTGAAGFGPPAVHDDDVYATTETGIVAVDAGDGTERWAAAAGTERRRVAVGDGAVVATERGTLTAVEAASGEERWQSEVSGERVPVVADSTVYVGGYQGLRALDSATGDERWTFDRGGGRTMSAPVVAPETLYVVEQPVEAGDATFALDRTDGAPDPRWCSDVSEGVVTAATPGGALGLLPGGVSPDEPGPPLRMVAFDEQLGDSRWGLPLRERLLPPAVVDGAVVVADREGTVRALGGT